MLLMIIVSLKIIKNNNYSVINSLNNSNILKL